MNYEQKYKNALERAKAINDGEYVDIEASHSICEYIFPELKESEDERIRRVLTDRFKRYQDRCGADTFDGVSVNAILAWLEKQGQVKKSPISQHENKTCEEKKEILTEEEPIDEEDAAYADAQQKSWEKFVYNSQMSYLSKRKIYDVGFYDGYEFGKKSN